MADNPLPRLVPIQIQLNHPIFQAICRWPFADEFVGRLLANDIPQRVKYGKGRIWVYRDPNQTVVGFGVIDVCDDYRALTGDKSHPYIPLLAVNPANQGRGYGTFIVGHLIAEAALLAAQPNSECHDVLFLEAYTSSEKAISLYERCGFARLRNAPFFDQVAQKPYFVMTKRVNITAI